MHAAGSARDILNDAGFVVGAHQRHQAHRTRLQLMSEPRPVDHAGFIDRNRLDDPAALVQRFRGFQYRRMLGRAIQHTRWHGAISHTFQRKIVRLRAARSPRSEEHTSELQSLMRISYAVFCLKKKKKTNTYNDYTT